MQEYVVWIGKFFGHEGRVGWKQLESQEHEGAEKGGTIWAGLENAYDAAENKKRMINCIF